MALLTSTEGRGGCPVCGSPDRSCGEVHTSDTRVVDVPAAHRRQPATHFARAKVNGVETIFKTTEAEANARGWELVGVDFQPLHKARPAPTPPTPAEPAQIEPDADSGSSTTTEAETAKSEPSSPVSAFEPLTVRELRALASEAEIPGRSKMDRDQLVRALAAEATG